MDEGQLVQMSGWPRGQLQVQVLEEGPAARALVLTGELDISVTHVLLKTIEGLGTEPGPVVLDARGVHFIDAGGLRALLRVRDELAERAEELVVLASPEVRRLAALADVVELDLR